MNDCRDDRARLAVILQADRARPRRTLWRVKKLHDLPVAWREEVANVLGCEAAARGLGADEVPNAYGVELGELFNALGP
jgi:hypothetical protein